jgi:hypothetical protein
MHTVSLVLAGSRRVHALGALTVTVALWLVLSATASAATFCAHSVTCAGGTPVANLAAGIGAAALNGSGRDTITLPAGNFADGPVTDGAGNPVDIVGAGESNTVITASTSGEAVTIAEPTSTMSQLEVRSTNTVGHTGIGLSGTIDHVRVTGVASSSGEIGVHVPTSQTATIKNSTIDLDYAPTWGAYGVMADQWSNVSIVDTDVQASRGVWIQGGTVDMDRDRIWAKQGVQALTGGYGTVRNTSVRTPGKYPDNGNPAFAFGAWGSYASEIDVTSSTAYGDGGPDSEGVWLNPLDNSSGVVSLTESVIANYSTVAEIGKGVGTSMLQTQWSAYDFTRITGTGNHWHAHDVDLAGVDPRFVDPAAGDLRLRFNSPLVDAGDPAALTSGKLDRDGNPRIVDGGHGSARVDMGALEYQHGAPTVSAQATPTAAGTAQPIGFSATAADPDPGEAVSVTWNFDDGTSAPGSTVAHAFATAGTHTATAVATDASGLTASASVTVSVTASSPAGGGSTAGAITSATGSTAVAPLVTGLRLSPSSFHARPAKPSSSGKRVRSGSKLSFTLSQPAAVTVTVQRAKGRKWIRVGSFTLKRGAGTTKVTFDGRVARKALRRGSYRMRVVARNQAGLTSKPALVKFRIV